MRGRPHARHMANIARLYAFRALVYFYLWLPTWVLYLQDMRGLSLTEVGLISSAGWVVMAAAEVPAGVFADRYGRPASLALGAASYALGSVGFALTGDVPLLVVSESLWTLGFAFISGADLALLYDTLRAGGQEGAYTRHAGRLQALMHGAQGVGALLGAPLAAALSLNTPHLGAAMLALPAVFIAWGLCETPAGRPDARGQAEPNPRASGAGAARGFVGLLRVPEVAHLLIYGAFLSLLPFFCFFILLQPYAVTVGVPVAWMGVLAVALRGVSMVAATWTEGLVHRFGEGRLLYTFPVLMTGAAAGIGAGDSAGGLVLVAAALAVGAAAQPLVSHLLQRRVDSAVRATALSLASLTQTVLLALLQPLVGGAADRWGVGATLGVLGMAASLACLLVLARWRPERDLAYGAR